MPVRAAQSETDTHDCPDTVDSSLVQVRLTVLTVYLVWINRVIFHVLSCSHMKPGSFIVIETVLL